MHESNPQPAPGDASADHGDRIYTPAPGELQLTVRAVLAGCALGGVVAAMNIYFGLRTGWSIGGSLIAAILGYSVFAALARTFKMPAYTVLETNITQTAGSAAGSMTSAAGLLAAIPALGMLGIKLSYLELSAWALAVAYLGVFFAVPLRNQMVVVEKLRFPTGTATAETIVSMFAEGAQALAQARALLIAGVLAAVFTLAAFFVSPLGAPPMEWFGLAAVGAWGFSLLLSPLMTGAGILIGPRVGLSLLSGALVSWALLGPWVQAQGWVGGPIMSYSSGVRGWILWPGVAIMVADALTNLALSWKTILNTFRRGTATGDADMEPTEEQVPNSWWIIGLGLGTAATVFVAWSVFAIPWWMTIIAVALSSVLAMIAVRSTGETDINPIGGMGKITQVVFGGVAPGQMTTNLMAAAISGAGASQAGDMMQDLKTGRMLGASPRKQIIAQCVGILAGIIVCVPIYWLFDSAYTIGGEELPAPAAHAWRAMAELLSKGLDALPTNAGWAVLGGTLFGIVVPVLRAMVPSVAKWLPSGIAFGIAFIVPAYYSVAMFVGAMALVGWQRSKPAQAAAYAIPLASGLIAGEGLMGVLVAILTLLGVEPIF